MKMNVTVKCRLRKYELKAAEVEIEETCTLRQALSKYILQGSELWKVKIIIKSGDVQLPNLDLSVKEYNFDEAGATLEAVVFVPMDYRNPDFDFKEAYEVVMDSPQQIAEVARDRYFNILASYVADRFPLRKVPGDPCEGKSYPNFEEKSINITFVDNWAEKKENHTMSIRVGYNEEDHMECFWQTYDSKTVQYPLTKFGFEGLLMQMRFDFRGYIYVNWIEYKPVALIFFLDFFVKSPVIEKGEFSSEEDTYDILLELLLQMQNYYKFDFCKLTLKNFNIFNVGEKINIAYNSVGFGVLPPNLNAEEQTCCRKKLTLKELTQLKCDDDGMLILNSCDSKCNGQPIKRTSNLISKDTAEELSEMNPNWDELLICPDIDCSNCYWHCDLCQNDYCTSCVPNDEQEEQDDENLNVPYYPIF